MVACVLVSPSLRLIIKDFVCFPFVRRKPKTQAGKRHLEKRSPKLIENDKSTIFIRGSKTSRIVEKCFDDLVQLKKPNAVRLLKKNLFLPFEDETPFANLSQKYDASMFCFISHSKKRPNNLVIGRMFDFNLLDMFEFGVENFASIEDFKKCAVPVGVKPCLLFMGEEFQSDPAFLRMKNLFVAWKCPNTAVTFVLTGTRLCTLISRKPIPLIFPIYPADSISYVLQGDSVVYVLDFFRGPVISKLRLQGIEYALTFTSVGGRILIRAYLIHLKKSDVNAPCVQLDAAGPSMDLVIRRNKIASDSLYKAACRVPIAAKPKKVKNIGQDVFGTTRGRIHVKQQSLSSLNLSKIKGLKARLSNGKSNDAAPSSSADLP